MLKVSYQLQLSLVLKSLSSWMKPMTLVVCSANFVFQPWNLPLSQRMPAAKFQTECHNGTTCKNVYLLHNSMTLPWIQISASRACKIDSNRSLRPLSENARENAAFLVFPLHKINTAWCNIISVLSSVHMTFSYVIEKYWFSCLCRRKYRGTFP